MKIDSNSRLICVRPDQYGLLKKGAEYRVREIYPCACGDIGIDVGLEDDRDQTECTCGAVTDGSVAIFSHTRFRVVDMNFGESIAAQLEKSFKEDLVTA